VTKQVFISYSHAEADRRWLNRLLTALKPYARKGAIDIFEDTQLLAGDRWFPVLERELRRADVAVLLVSANFLASDFVADVELPYILARARAGAMTVTWVPVAASAYKDTELNGIQPLTDAKRPLALMSKPVADAALVRIAGQIAGARTVTDLGRAMHVVDEVYTEVAPDVGIDSSHPRSVQARHTGVAVAFERRGVAEPIATITAADLENLAPKEHRRIQSLETSMSKAYKRWRKLRPQRQTLGPKKLQKYVSAGREMCVDLNKILDFIELDLGKQLEDHYFGIRRACDKLGTPVIRAGES
jgi:hypothetical protein